MSFQSADQRAAIYPIYQRLREEFEEKIASQIWRPGEPIPAETALATAYNVAPGTVRKAIEMLVSEGILERQQGKGTFVRKASFDTSLWRFFRFQSRSGERVLPVGRMLQREVVPSPPEIARKLGLPDGAPAIHIFRLRTIESEPLLVDDIWLSHEKFASLQELPDEQIKDGLYVAYEAQCGQVIAWAEEDLTAEAADPDTAGLLGIPAGQPVIVIERVAFGFDREVLEWRRCRGRADRFRYHVETR
jgi:GntR family transcriptional regulator